MLKEMLEIMPVNGNESEKEDTGAGRGGVGRGRAGQGRRLPTLLRVWVCPIRMRALEEMMDRQKLMRITDRSERMYL